MFDRIIYISDKSCNIKLRDNENIAINLMNLHLVFEDQDKVILGEVDDLDGDIVKARFLGEIKDGRLIGGTTRKPSLDAKIRVITKEEIPLLTGEDKEGFMPLGTSPFYNDFPVYLDVNSFFSNHFAIFGNTGSGKSCGTTRLFQNMFHDSRLDPYKSNIFMFDSSGEYYNAFSNLSTINPNYHYRFITTGDDVSKGEALRIPIFLLNVDDLALLLQCNQHSQLPIIERMLKLALVFSQEDMDANNYKNHLIAKAIMSILYTNETSPNKRNEVFSILASCSTNEFSLETPVEGIGYTRKFRELFLINSTGEFAESVLLTEYVSSFIKPEYDNYEPKGGVFYNLDTLEKALNFTLISEGWLRNEQTYGDAVTIRVRLHSLITSSNSKFFDVDEYISLENFLSSLIIKDGDKYQFININLDDVDDSFAKVIVKIYSRLIFDFAKQLPNRASIPFHIILEEAHRYIQNDNDRFLFGYNIFERIAKEGRKYGVMLGLISQRPVEISDTVISQCTNFLIFKINHPVDVEYIRKMVPNITEEIVEKQKGLQSGTCLGFGLGFRIPLIIRMQMPDPAPWSGNCNVVSIWSGGSIPKSYLSSSENISTGVASASIEESKPLHDAFTQEIPDLSKDYSLSLESNQNAELFSQDRTNLVAFSNPVSEPEKVPETVPVTEPVTEPVITAPATEAPALETTAPATNAPTPKTVPLTEPVTEPETSAPETTPIPEPEKVDTSVSDITESVPNLIPEITTSPIPNIVPEMTKESTPVDQVVHDTTESGNMLVSFSTPADVSPSTPVEESPNTEGADTIVSEGLTENSNHGFSIENDLPDMSASNEQPLSIDTSGINDLTNHLNHPIVDLVSTPPSYNQFLMNNASNLTIDDDDDDDNPTDFE